MNQYTSGWSPEEIAELIRMNSAGLGSKAMSQALGRSQKSVNSKRWSLGLPVAERLKVEPKPRPVRIEAAPAPAAAPPVVEFPVRGVRITDAGFGGCRWPTGGEGADTTFCCTPTDGDSYCRVHRRHAFSTIPLTGRRSTSELIRGLRRYA